MEPAAHDDPIGDELPDRADVVVVGAGLAGLTAGAVAARSGARAVVLDAHEPGGRAAVRRVPLDGLAGDAVFNGGPRALYLGGAGRAVLDRLGVAATGKKPPTKGSGALVDGRLDVLPTGAGSLLRSGIVSRAAKPRLTAVLGAILTGRVAPGRVDQSATEWILDAAHGHDDVADAVAALFRVATYTADLDLLSADAAVPHVVHAIGKGVRYLDGGFQQLVDGLAARGRPAGMTVHGRAPVAALELRPDGAWTVRRRDGRELVASAVVVAAGGPAVASALLDRPDLVDRVGPAVTAACLELAVAGPVPTRFVLGIDEPLYLSEHAPPAYLAPEGVRIVHVARYGATSADADRTRLGELAELAGIRDVDVVARRFLSRMVVQTGLPSIATGGLAGRPAVAVGERPGAFLAGDWVGPVGLLADAALASGESAGALAAAHALAAGRATVGAEAR
jgi:phytoene dehydrogenase-like protein